MSNIYLHFFNVLFIPLVHIRFYKNKRNNAEIRVISLHTHHLFCFRRSKGHDGIFHRFRCADALVADFLRAQRSKAFWNLVRVALLELVEQRELVNACCLDAEGITLPLNL